MKVFVITPENAGLAQFNQAVVVADSVEQVQQILQDHKKEWGGEMYVSFPKHHPQSTQRANLSYCEKQGKLTIEEIDLTQTGFVTGDYNYE